jgi:hypothetical protein
MTLETRIEDVCEAIRKQVVNTDWTVPTEVQWEKTEYPEENYAYVNVTFANKSKAILFYALEEDEFVLDTVIKNGIELDINTSAIKQEAMLEKLNNLAKFLN